MGLYMICIMITALAPNLPVQLIFRFFAGLFASPTLTIYGGRSSITFMRYTVSAGMVIADRSMHKIMGVHWTETMMGCLGAAALLEVWASDQEQKEVRSVVLITRLFNIVSAKKTWTLGMRLRINRIIKL
ncbi:hypothetical protein E6O75_ATG01614 [Venturia nashicola]|uniref:Uncharacterized protein n=1 Tax=Venturia nashicola TaxID=86259 RepID=A0A4Z1P0D3_9PEZI|nr:hypothetical protein E6O75_ATG01614 [Venturia nashicola]